MKTITVTPIPQPDVMDVYCPDCGDYLGRGTAREWDCAKDGAFLVVAWS